MAVKIITDQGKENRTRLYAAAVCGNVVIRLWLNIACAVIFRDTIQNIEEQPVHGKYQFCIVSISIICTFCQCFPRYFCIIKMVPDTTDFLVCFMSFATDQDYVSRLCQLMMERIASRRLRIIHQGSHSSQPAMTSRMIFSGFSPRDYRPQLPPHPHA